MYSRKISQEKLKKMENSNKQIKVLAVDDEIVNLKVIKKRIENTLPDIMCDIATSGKEAVEMSKNGYHLILMDIQMPGMNGIEATKNIRIDNKRVPVIAYSSLEYDSFLKETKDGDFNYYLNKPAPDGILFRSITKWIFDYQDSFSYLKPDYKKALSGKKILVVDDQLINRMIIRKNLEKIDIIISEASDGNEMIKLYKESLDYNHQTKFDLILSDIKMPNLDGYDATKEIRNIERVNRIKYQNHIPIVSVSGDSKKETITNSFQVGMDDYFIKGSNPNLLVKIIASYILHGYKEIIKTDNLPNTIEKEAGKDSLKLEQSNFKTLNISTIRSYNNSDQKEILKLFLESSKRIMDEIQKIAKDGQPQALHYQIHCLKGICGNIGADRLFEYTKEVDSELKNGRLPKNQYWVELLESLYRELEQEVNVIILTYFS